MPQSYSMVFVHVVWATWDRQPLLEESVRARVWAIVAEQLRRLGSAEVVVGGVSDHVHVLFALPPTTSVSAAVKQIKGASSRFAFSPAAQVAVRWQRGYFATSVGTSEVDRVKAYVRNQAHHHGEGTVSADLEPPPQP